VIVIAIVATVWRKRSKSPDEPEVETIPVTAGKTSSTHQTN
jgi:hypothetical protein